MAATSRFSDAHAPELADDDPFAELTRIMGHDPRAASVRPPEAKAEPADDGLGIDLENELMAGLSDFEAVTPEAAFAETAHAPDEAAPVSDVAAEADADDLDADLVAAFEAEFDGEGEAVHQAEDHASHMEADAEDAARIITATENDFAPAFDGFDAGAETQSYLEEHEPTEAQAQPTEDEPPHADEEAGQPDIPPFIVTGLAAPFFTPPRAAEAAHDAPLAMDAGAAEGLEAEQPSLQAAPVSDGEPTAPTAADAPEISAAHELESDAVDAAQEPLAGDAHLEAHDEHDASGQYDAAGQADEHAFDYRKAAVDRHEFLEETVDTPPKSHLPLRDHRWTLATPVSAAFATGASRAQGEAFEPKGDAAPEADSGASTVVTPSAYMAALKEQAPQPPADRAPEEPRAEAFEPRTEALASSVSSVPEAATVTDAPEADAPPSVETVEIAEKPIAATDDLGIPEPEPVVEEVNQDLAFDELAEELAGAFGAMEDEAELSREQAQAPAPATNATEPAAMAAAYHETEHPVDAAEGVADGVAARYDADLHQEFGAWSADDGDFERDAYAGEVPPAATAPVGYRGYKWRSARLGLIAASLLLGVAVIGGIGTFAFSSGEITGGDPALVTADNEPFKVRPKNGGGDASEEAENNEVYQRASGIRPVGSPEQTTLVSTIEDPVDLTSRDALPGVRPVTVEEASANAAAKTEDRLAPAAEDRSAAEPAPIAVEPHRVKTFIVRADGTLVPREETEAEPVRQASASQALLSDASGEAGLAEDPATGSTGAGAAEGAADEPDTAAQSPANDQPAAPAAEAQPAEATQVASTEAADEGDKPLAAAASQTAASSEWKVQISSQPSVESAQTSYRNMAARYGDVLAGRGVDIVKADIAGKGTYYRVRIPASSRDDAVALCTKLKSAGGSCFVSK